MSKHWTAKSVKDFMYRIASDFIVQLEKRSETEGITRERIATNLKVSAGRVSQVMNNPGNLTLKNIVQYAHVFGMKVAIVAYDDGDPGNTIGPVNSEIFEICWDRCGKPRDFFALGAGPAVARPTQETFMKIAGNFAMFEESMGDPPTLRTN